MTFRFPSSGDDRSTIAVLDAGYTVPGWSKPLYENLRFSVHSKSRIALVGPNGCGKSTLLGLLTGRLRPTTGEISPDRKLIVGRYDQHFDELLPVETNLSGTAHVAQTFNLSEQDARKLLGRSGLESSAHLTPVKSLSGGQKSRVVFACLAATEADILVLDEPTNHLDLESVEALVEGLNAFEGGIVVSTHDARLVEGLDDVEVGNTVYTAVTVVTITLLHVYSHPPFACSLFPFKYTHQQTNQLKIIDFANPSLSKVVKYMMNDAIVVGCE